MSEKILKEIVSELSSIYSNIPSEADLYDIEKKLDKLIDLVANQNEISERIANSLDNISDNIPQESGVSTSLIESRLESVWDKLDDIGDTLNAIQFNTGN
ncbi:MAG: hypothetical protein R3342_13165 [Lutibacter sp.]|uniref:hypothetical protein n=1 Tax=Lutibacter sp. TaxID=1925666 RepID=UPI00299D055B|nr:hypothetical protein [Lutibacter sp.]MDX1830483.1 hypothetical protein [Lutibacter sp.]